MELWQRMWEPVPDSSGWICVVCQAVFKSHSFSSHMKHVATQKHQLAQKKALNGHDSPEHSHNSPQCSLVQIEDLAATSVTQNTDTQNTDQPQNTDAQNTDAQIGLIELVQNFEDTDSEDAMDYVNDNSHSSDGNVDEPLSTDDNDELFEPAVVEMFVLTEMFTNVGATAFSRQQEEAIIYSHNIQGSNVTHGKLRSLQKKPVCKNIEGKDVYYIPIGTTIRLAFANPEIRKILNLFPTVTPTVHENFHSPRWTDSIPINYASTGF
ncbi:hypothetical protein BDR26DRAFT_902035 [Obelidium mucronatum]|nr:hypothetical protein BDR26DRAFT_902035 [Obelidium mucronatum]